MDFQISQQLYGNDESLFPNSNNTVSFISENKNVNFKLNVQNNKVKDMIYLDEANELMSKQQEGSQKKELILPALAQIKEYYKDNTDFGKALKTEIDRLSGLLQLLTGTASVYSLL
jgi:hypothetical protein